jgi:hypothetical protein
MLVLWYYGYLPWNSINHIVTSIVIKFKLSHSDCTAYLLILLGILKHNTSLTLLVVCVYDIVCITAFALSARLILVSSLFNFVLHALVLLLHVFPYFEISIKILKSSSFNIFLLFKHF